MERLNFTNKDPFDFNERYVIVMIIFLAICFVGGFTIMTLRSYQLDKEYPTLTRADSIFDYVSATNSDTRGLIRVIFQNGKKYSLTWAINLKYEKSSLTKMIEVGDLIQKSADSDSVVVLRNNMKFFYEINKLIGGDSSISVPSEH